MEKKYDVYFELYGHKMKTSVFAETESQAMNVVRNKIKFNKVYADPNNTFNQADSKVDELMNIFGMNK